jgi:hypothetical protein
VVTAVRTTLTILAIGYILWTNFVIFNGGNLPLTSMHISDGSAGAGTFMLFIGNWLALLLFQLLVNSPIEYLLTGLLQPRHLTAASAPVPVQPLAPVQPVPPVPPAPPGWSVTVPTPSTPLSALLTDDPGATRIFVPPQGMSRDYLRELN